MVALRSVVALVVGFGRAAEGVRTKKRTSITCGVKGLTSQKGPTSLIVNGETADECAWPWQVNVKKIWQDEVPQCGGTLIAPDWILTAASFVHGKMEELEVRAGDYNFRKGKESANLQVRKLKRKVMIPLYNVANKSHDIALLQLEKPFELSQCVSPACLPTEKLASGSKCWITGWGNTAQGGPRADVLQEAPVETLNNFKCSLLNLADGYAPGMIDKSMVCAEGRTEDGKITEACSGDQGSPLMCEKNGVWSVNGVTSWGSGCGRKKVSVYARVHSAIDWIEALINGEE